MKRREFIAGLGGAAAAWPMATRAQQAKMSVIGLLNGVTSEAIAGSIAAIRRGLQDAGFVEGRNLSIEVRAADGQYERLPALAADLVHRQVAVIIAIGGPPAALAAKAATSTTPIVFAMGADAVEIGLVKSLNRPEANVTGASFATGALAPRRLQLILEMVPHATVIGYLDNQREPTFELRTRNIATAAQTKGRQLVPFGASTEQEIDAAFADMLRRRIGALVVSPDAFFFARQEQIVSLAARHGLPTIYSGREFVVAGGLMSYGVLVEDMYRQAGLYAGRILKGEKPADLPVLFPTKFEFLVNLKAAKSLGLTIPPNLLALADEVIE
jgi:putative tryptophan/tyrosine transport system substrate-binding protein